MLRDRSKLVEAQRRDAALEPGLIELKRGRVEKGCYFLDDHQLLWYAPRGGTHAAAAPREDFPGVLALMHGTYGHPGILRPTRRMECRHHWPKLKGRHTRIRAAANVVGGKGCGPSRSPCYLHDSSSPGKCSPSSKT